MNHLVNIGMLYPVIAFALVYVNKNEKKKKK
jgi:hypothetical protein